MSHRKNTAENVPIQSSNITFPIFFSMQTLVVQFLSRKI